MYNEFKETVKNPTILAKLAPLLNPATALPILAVGTIWYCVYKMAEKGDNEPLPTAIATVETASEPLNEPLELNGLNGSIPIENPIAEPSIESMDKSEIIRMAMSELGKRSAATRAKNKES